MRRSIVVPGKYGMAALMLTLNEEEVKVEAIPVNMYLIHTATNHLKYKGERTAVMVHAGHINETSTLGIPT